MSNDVPIRDADHNKQTFVTLATSLARYTQPTLAQAIVSDAPTAMSASTSVPIDNELPQAAAPSDADAAVPAIAARSQLSDPATNRWRLSQVTADGRRARAFPAQVSAAQRRVAADSITAPGTGL